MLMLIRNLIIGKKKLLVYEEALSLVLGHELSSFWWTHIM